MTEQKSKIPGREARAAISRCRTHMCAAAVFSLAINVLFLTYPIYMLQVYDRVLASESLTTLVMLSVAAFIALSVMGGLDIIRARLFVRAGVRFDRHLHSRVLRALVDRGDMSGTRSQALTDLDTVRQVISGSATATVFDIPWVPIYMIVLSLLHPVLGAVGLAGALVLIGLSVANQIATRRPLAEAAQLSLQNQAKIGSALSKGEAIRALGMLPALEARWSSGRHDALCQQITANDRGAVFSGITKTVRFLLQVSILAFGSYLAIKQEISPGAMIAGMILVGRAIAPIDQVIASWKQLVSASQAYRRISELLDAVPAPEARMELPRPDGRLSVDRAVYVPVGQDRPIIKGISFEVAAGETIGVIGPSAAGKSTLARLLVGVLRTTSGAVRLDGAEVSAYSPENLGSHIGYLPQDIELFAGTVKDNIARFAEADSESVVAAAKLAGIHEMILRLPKGYDTEIGDEGAMLSTGQRQRLGLARAVFGQPRFVVLDEPNASLDAEGEAALVQTLDVLKRAGATVIVIAHRPSMLRMVDKLLVLRDGTVDMFGPRDEILAKTTRGVVKAVPDAQMRQAESN